DNMNDSSDDEDDEDDEPRNTETPKPLVDQVAPPPVEEEEERLNPLFASISESTGHVCVLCGVSGGDLAATSCGHKAHIMCLLYTPETYFEHAMGFGVANIPPRRRTLVCALCKTSTGVNKIQCHAKKCTKPMHVQNLGMKTKCFKWETQWTFCLGYGRGSINLGELVVSKLGTTHLTLG
ncbi:hypothetical protein DYB34_006830, partial [Aphanomyces astaci]